jgi:hypothetical protein
MFSFTLVISCEGLTLLPLTSKGVYKDNYSQFNPSTARVLSLSWITLHKKGNELKRYFPNLIKALLHKGL